MPCFIGIRSSPFLGSFVPKATLVNLSWVVGLAFKVVSLMMGRKSSRWMSSTERLQYFGLVFKLVFPLIILLVIIRLALILVATEQMTSRGIPEPFFHIVGGNVLGPNLDSALLVPCIIHFILVLFEVLELGVFTMIDQ